jgi:hypothetical protein
MSLPTTPEGWAIHLSRLVKVVHEAHGIPRFPVNVASIATDYSRNVFPKNPITLVQGAALGTRFEGQLLPHPGNNGEWGIIYNSAIRSKGRINFTLGHELGHYLLHRHLGAIQCTTRDMYTWNSEYGQREAQANTFASYLLMPLDDFREEIKDVAISLTLMKHLSDRYEVSMTAAILKWLSITQKRAMLVVSKDGFIDWSRSSERLLKSGIYYRARQEVIALPDSSLATTNNASPDTELMAAHKPGVWLGTEDVCEMTLFGANSELVLSLLLYPDNPPAQNYFEEDEGGLLATDRFFAGER